MTLKVNPVTLTLIICGEAATTTLGAKGPVKLTNPPAKGRSILRTLTPQVCPLNPGHRVAPTALNSPLQEESIYYKLIRVIFPKA